MTSKTNITLAVLAGGEGARMGRPKAELTVAGVPILRWLIKRWRWDGPTLLVTAPGRAKPPGAEAFEREVSDAVAGEGPLRGLATALAAARTPILVVATCDMPLIEPEQLSWLAEELLRRRGSAWMLMTRGPRGEEQAAPGQEAQGEIEPFPCAVQRAGRKAIERHLATGARSLHSLASLAGVEIAPAPSHWTDESFTNLNHPHEYEAFAARAQP